MIGDIVDFTGDLQTTARDAGTMADVHRILSWHVGDDFTIDVAFPSRLRIRVRVPSDCTDRQLDDARRDVSAAISQTVHVDIERRAPTKATMHVMDPARQPFAPSQPALPWPWRACKGGRVLAANGGTVTKVANRREAVRVVRETGEFLRTHALLGAGTIATPMLAADEWELPGEFVINGQHISIADTRTVTVDALVAAINLQTTFTASRSTENPSTVCLQLHPGLTSLHVQVSGDD